MTRPNPPSLVSTVVTISFEPRDSKGNNPGDYEMFVDVSGSASAPVGIKVIAPEGFSVPDKGVKLYEVTPPQGSNRIPTSQDKADAITKLKQGKYDDVFDGELPDGFHFDAPNGMLIDQDDSPKIYEYLVHLQKADGTNDYADPGIRNR